MKCLNCGKHPAQRKEPYGYLPCTACMKRQRSFTVAAAIEVTTSEIKESRKQYAKDIIQRFRNDTPSLEYIRTYGPKGFTKDQLTQARNVWTENQFYNDKHDKYKKERDAK